MHSILFFEYPTMYESNPLVGEVSLKVEFGFFFFFQCYSSILFRRWQEREREKSAHTRERESERKLFGSSFYVFSLHLGLPFANWA